VDLAAARELEYRYKLPERMPVRGRATPWRSCSHWPADPIPGLRSPLREMARVEMVQLSGKTLGLLGLGAIGNHVARMAKGLGMNAIAWTLHPTPERQEERPHLHFQRGGPQDIDVVSLHLRLSDETRGFFKREDFESMKPTAFLLNTARAG